MKCKFSILVASATLIVASAAAQGTPKQRADSHMAKAMTYLQEKQPALAIPELRDVVRLDPGNLNARANLGVLLYFSGDYKGAIPQLQQALQQQPDLAKIRSLLGSSEKRTGDLDRAAADLKLAFDQLDEKKLKVQSGLELLETYSALGSLDKAAAVAGALQQQDPENPVVLSAVYQVYNQLSNQALLSLAAAAPDSAQMHMLMAHELVRQGNNAAALEQYREALKVDPDLPGLHYEYGELLYESPQPELKAQAEAQYHAALKVNPYDAQADRGLGDIAADKGNAKEAQAYYSHALALHPDDSETETDLAKVLISLGQKQDAFQLLQKAVEQDPTNFTAHYRLSTLYRQMGRPEDAKRELQKFQHYKQLKDKFGKVFQQMRNPGAAQDGGMK